MGASGSPPDVTAADVRNLFSQFDQPATPITAGEVAENLDCPRERAEKGLRELSDRGELQTRRLDYEKQVWWPSVQQLLDEQHSEQEEFSTFVSAVKDYAIFRLDPDGFVTNWNEGAERIKGYAADDIAGGHFSTFYTEDDITQSVPQRNLETATKQGRIEDKGWRVRQDGSRFWAHVTITAVRDDTGELRGFMKVTRDMTERRFCI